MKKPIIGIVLDLMENSKNYLYSPKPWYALRANYSNMIEKSGGSPVLLPYTNDIKLQIDIIDGLLIPGNDKDINPKFYSKKIISNKVRVNDKRTLYELELTKEALKRNIPVFGICNGLQLINVLLGGTLIQHIPDIYKSNINHEQPHPKCKPTHDIFIKEGTLLSELTRIKKARVNTTHHQAIDQLGDGLIVSARASDGIIEAIESKNYRFLVGVQWHSEYENLDLDSNLFDRFVKDSNSN